MGDIQWIKYIQKKIIKMVHDNAWGDIILTDLEFSIIESIFNKTPSHKLFKALNKATVEKAIADIELKLHNAKKGSLKIKQNLLP